MLIDRYPAEDVFARVPELAGQTDPVLVQLDRLLDDDWLFAQVRTDLVRRHRLTAIHMADTRRLRRSLNMIRSAGAIRVRACAKLIPPSKKPITSLLPFVRCCAHARARG